MEMKMKMKEMMKMKMKMKIERLEENRCHEEKKRPENDETQFQCHEGCNRDLREGFLPCQDGANFPHERSPIQGEGEWESDLRLD